jgi:hypothetical protein
MNNSDKGPDDGNVLEQLIKLIINMPQEKRLRLLNRIEDDALGEDPDLKRDEPRKAYDRTVYFDFENYTYAGTIMDISTTGIFIETRESFKIGQMVMVNIPDTHDDSYVRLAGEIVRTEPEGIGVKFISKGIG